MLRIKIPATGTTRLTSADFKNYHLPMPSKGVKANKNESTVLQFDNEYDAVVYADQLEEIVTTVSKNSPVKNILRDLATAIRNDDSIRNYLENSSIYVWITNRVKSIKYAMKPAAYFSKN
jgi:hypothetical protein